MSLYKGDFLFSFFFSLRLYLYQMTWMTLIDTDTLQGMFLKLLKLIFIPLNLKMNDIIALFFLLTNKGCPRILDTRRILSKQNYNFC